MYSIHFIFNKNSVVALDLRGRMGEREIEAKRGFRDSGNGRSKRSRDSATAEMGELKVNN